ncbi:MAG: hypothetical protein ABI765_15020 [Gemmatimonadota bacterium]
MAHWTLETISAETKPHDTTELFGNHVIVSFRLKYTSSALGAGKFKEPPVLDWNEVIMMNELHKKESWVFSTNMYRHNPLSATLLVWPRRYIAAYDHANGTPDSFMKGSSILTDAKGRTIGVDKLGKGLLENAQKADAVRSYLKKHGGVLTITIDDIPSINIPKDATAKERLLIFNCGLEDQGSGPRAKIIQHLVVDGSKPKSSWTRRVDLSHTITGLKTSGLKIVQPPAIVASPRTPLFGSGEYL